MKEIKAYQCDHCVKYLKTKHLIKKHEARCFYNPATKSCITCDHFSPNVDGEVGRYCEAKRKDLKKLRTGCPIHRSELI